MHTAPRNWLNDRIVMLAAVVAGGFPIAAPAAEIMPPAQQNALVQKYCAVCHTDSVKNGGLSLAHYDATELNPALAAMLLSKLRNGAMGAAGLGIPDPTTREAWVAATATQAENAKGWTVLRSEVPASKAHIVTASMVREVAPRQANTDSPVYRLTFSCDSVSRKGEVQLTWSPAPQTDRAFSVAVDGNQAIPHRLEGREEKMGNGAVLTSGLASAVLHAPWADRTLTVRDLFAGETVEFPVGELGPADRLQLAACFAGGTH